MKTIVPTTLVLFTFFAAAAAGAPSAPAATDRFVNAYGEPAGFADLPQVIVPESAGMNFSASRPGLGGMYAMPGTVDPRNFESLGEWQDRTAAEASGIVTIGALEVLDSGPTGPLTPDVQAAARDDVTAKVLGRIQATDRIMAGLRSEAADLDPDTQARFKATAVEVDAHRHTLREDLKAVRAADESEWPAARSEVAVSFNAYVQSMHRAEAIVSAPANS